jgi:hypothetical protein
MIKTATNLKHLILALILLAGTNAHAGIVRAIQTGNWENTSTWLLGILPSNGDSIIIPAGKSVKITTIADYSSGAAMGLNIFGELTFQTGKKLILPIGSTITLQVAAMITPGGGGGNSNLIDIGTVMVWNTAMGTITGFLTLPSSPLPVELVDFNVRPNTNETISLSWKTATEVNNDYFEIEHSQEGLHFETIGRIDGHGTSSNVHEYKFTDAFPKEGSNYYRLKQVDFDNKFNYTRILLCKLKMKEKEPIQLFPNPAKGDVYMTISENEINSPIEVMVTDTKANIILQKQIQCIPGSKGILLIGQENIFKPGIYFVTATVNNELFKKQLIVY